MKRLPLVICGLLSIFAYINFPFHIDLVSAADFVDIIPNKISVQQILWPLSGRANTDSEVSSFEASATPVNQIDWIDVGGMKGADFSNGGYLKTSPLPFSAQDFTISAWIRPNFDLEHSIDHAAIFDWQSTPGDANRIYLRFEDKNYGFMVDSANAFSFTYLPTEMKAHTWYHIAFVRQGSSGQFYWNGKPVQTTKTTGSNFTNHDINSLVYIGFSLTPQARTFPGSLAQIFLSTYGLSDQDIAKIYTETRPNQTLISMYLETLKEKLNTQISIPIGTIAAVLISFLAGIWLTSNRKTKVT